MKKTSNFYSIDDALTALENTLNELPEGVQVQPEVIGINSRTIWDENTASVEVIPFQINWSGNIVNYDFSPYAINVSSDKPCDEIVVSCQYGGPALLIIGLENQIPQQMIYGGSTFRPAGVGGISVTTNAGLIEIPNWSIKLPRQKHSVTLMPFQSTPAAAGIYGSVVFINSQVQCYNSYRAVRK